MRRLHIDPKILAPKKVKAVAEALLQGQVGILPTETVYGLVCDERKSAATQRIYEIKGRSSKKPIARLVDRLETIEKHGAILSQNARRLAAFFWPGPLTMVLPHKKGEKIAFRIPDHPVALAVLQEVMAPIMATSANISHGPEAVAAEEAEKIFQGEIDFIVDGGMATIKKGSTVIACEGKDIRVIREGALSLSSIYACLNNTNA